MAKPYWVYILASRSRRLYIGVTNDLARRLAEHRSGTGSVFARRYRIDRLVHFEEYGDIRDAIAREKRLKGWTRERKLRLVESANAGWIDLAPRDESRGGSS
ncbi:GIY-YIG nuclease family protein [Rubrivirga sp.]|uniref:GIY-YIG nuclease family protein n=1 Tax=Rubrivirga sp. TaxID=1885344 RepID=UPI003B5230CD